MAAPSSIWWACATMREMLASDMPAKPTKVTVRLTLSGALANTVSALQPVSRPMPATSTRLRAG